MSASVTQTHQLKAGFTSGQGKLRYLWKFIHLFLWLIVVFLKPPWVSVTVSVFIVSVCLPVVFQRGSSCPTWSDCVLMHGNVSNVSTTFLWYNATCKSCFLLIYYSMSASFDTLVSLWCRQLVVELDQLILTWCLADKFKPAAKT